MKPPFTNEELKAHLRAFAVETGRSAEAESYIEEAEHLEGEDYWINFFYDSTAKEDLIADFELHCQVAAELDEDRPAPPAKVRALVRNPFMEPWPTYLEIVPVKSTSIESVSYDRDNHILRVVFNTGGVYRYSNVQPIEYVELIDAPSKGKHFDRTFRRHPEKYPVVQEVSSKKVKE